jgi:hypothetical protein
LQRELSKESVKIRKKNDIKNNMANKVGQPDRVFKIRASPTLRKQIIKIISENHLSIQLICNEIGYKYVDMVMWLNAKDGGRPSDNMSEHYIQKICEILGIEITILFTVHPVPEQSLEKFTNKSMRDVIKRKKEYKEKKIKEFFEDEA